MLSPVFSCFGRQTRTVAVPVQMYADILDIHVIWLHTETYMMTLDTMASNSAFFTHSCCCVVAAVLYSVGLNQHRTRTWAAAASSNHE